MSPAAVGYGAVLERELEWLLADGTLLEPGGPFAVAVTQVRRLSQGHRQLFLAHASMTARSRSKAGDRQEDHALIALVLWPALGGGTHAGADQDRLDVAVAKLLARIQADDDHGGRWWSVSTPVVAPPSPLTALAYRDAIAASGNAYTLTVTWTCSEWVDG